MLSDFEMFPDRVRNADRSMWAFSISNTSSLPSLLEPSRKVDSLSGPAAQLHSSLGSAIGPLMDCEHVINSYILTVPQSETISEMDARRRRMVSMSRNAENKNNAEQLEEYINEVHKEKLITVKTHTNILVWDAHDNLQQVKGRVSAALAGIGIGCVQDIYDTPVLWYSALPGAECELGSENLMLMELGSALCLGVNESFETGLPGGLLKLCDRTRNIPLEIDIQRKAHEAGLIDNYNAFILGGSGTGKSFFTNFFVRSCYDAGETVFIIDVGDSYEGLCSVIHEESGGRDGIYHTWDMNNPLSFDAFLDFEQWTDLSGTLRQDSDGLNFLLSFLQTLWSPQGGWSADSANILKQMIRDFRVSWNKDRRPVFDDLRSYLIDSIMPRMEAEEGYMCGEIRITSMRFDISGLVLAMGDYSSGGAFGFLLNDPEPKDLFSSRFTVFEVEKLASVNDSKFYSLCILCIMNSFNAKMRSQDGMKVMVIEEAWKAIANETMAPFLTGLWKTARKYSTSAVVVTQQITDIMSSSVINDTILQNSSVRILLDQSNNLNNFDQIKTLLGLSDHQKAMILSMNRNNSPRYRYREVFIALGDRRCGVYATEVSPEEAIAYESSKEKKKPFLELQQSKGAIAAIRELTEGKS
jgi:conjugation system TraG family ATPase